MGFLRNSSNGNNDERDDLAEINMIPLIDVMLVLLIVFMVAAPLSISGIKIQLPTSKAKGLPVEENKVILTIDQKGQYFIDKMGIEPEKLQDRIVAIFAPKEDKALYIRADERVAYGRVVDAMSAAKLAGVHKLAMLTTRPEAKK